jgi:hypothetical protein
MEVISTSGSMVLGKDSGRIDTGTELTIGWSQRGDLPV